MYVSYSRDANGFNRLSESCFWLILFTKHNRNRFMARPHWQQNDAV